MTIKELRKLIRRPGRLLLPVLIPDNVTHMEVKKSEILRFTEGKDAHDKSPWMVIDETPDEIVLDINP